MNVSTHRPLQALALALLAACAVGASAQSSETSSQRHPDVVSATVAARDAATFDFAVTVSSPYDTPQRYADAFRVLADDGTVFGERKLLHDHASEQPFTRELHGITIPRGVRTVVIQARDQQHGYGGRTVELALPGR